MAITCKRCNNGWLRKCPKCGNVFCPKCDHIYSRPGTNHECCPVCGTYAPAL